MVAKEMRMMNKLAEITWNANHDIVLVLNVCTRKVVRPNLENNVSKWVIAVKINLNKFDKGQNQAIMIITGAMKPTPIKELESIAQI